MKYALFNGKKSEPQKGQEGICEVCGEPVIARCGNIRVHHWAHKSGIVCDSWEQLETEWHRNWKNQFPAEQQEICMEANGEKHRADVKTPTGWVYEFQHSDLSEDDINARESFYKKMIWVVDGTRRKRDLRKYQSAIAPDSIFSLKDNPMRQETPELVFPKEWCFRPMPVCFDYNGAEWAEGQKVYCLYRGWSFAMPRQHVAEKILCYFIDIDLQIAYEIQCEQEKKRRAYSAKRREILLGRGNRNKFRF